VTGPREARGDTTTPPGSHLPPRSAARPRRRRADHVAARRDAALDPGLARRGRRGEVRLNTTLERQSGRNLRRDPRLSLLAVDPADSGRYVQLRGDAELVLDGVTDHLDRLTRAYTSHPSYYGHVHPREQAALETRVVVRILAKRITLDAVHV
jgi:hypothetical protein